MPTELEQIIQGYKKFRQKYFEGQSQLYEKLKDGQKPKFLVVACSDSRVDPAIILNCRPGDLFVVRNVANLIPPCENDGGYHGTSAALEFAVLGLGIRHIIILGHSSCGGIQALVENSLSHFNQNEEQFFINKWMEIAKPALQKTIEIYPNQSTKKQIGNCARFALINSMENLLTFSWIRHKVATKELFLHSWYFNIDSGIIEKFNPQTNKFIDLEPVFKPS